jgi:hypothetical protein
MTLRLMPQMVLVALPPVAPQTVGARILPASTATPTSGIVQQVADDVEDVAPGDGVVFGTHVGQPLDVDGWPHLLLAVGQIDAVVER